MCLIDLIEVFDWQCLDLNALKSNFPIKGLDNSFKFSMSISFGTNHALLEIIAEGFVYLKSYINRFFFYRESGIK